MDVPFAVILLIPFLAVWISFAFVWWKKPKQADTINLLLAFSGAFLLALTFFELLPEVYHAGNPKHVALFVLAGILLQVFLEFFSKGAEHGHMHHPISENTFPLMLFLSLSIHALVEGVPLDGTNSMLYGIVIHKIPVTLILSIFLVNSKMKPSFVVLFIALFSLMTPLGTYLAAHSPWVDNHGFLLNSLAIGVFLHISTIILFESSKGHSFDFKKLIVIVLGVAVAYFI
ncbi:ZIP family metal transporter [Muricauda sp. JGD-17]|uniref:ZIP family metal transporter n=1 Tax=Flagellimonas ochracea TaxID=2696472 RepID=A0A964WYG1_9FLAO|nr:ZIP family metal transporter [Allomuricauda ochracea]NAY93145.1 ZIP family metal transporter [Allomuricauda ochracea]